MTFKSNWQKTKQTIIVVIGALRVKTDASLLPVLADVTALSGSCQFSILWSLMLIMVRKYISAKNLGFDNSYKLYGDNLYEMPKPIFWDKYHQFVVC